MFNDLKSFETKHRETKSVFTDLMFWGNQDGIDFLIVVQPEECEIGKGCEVVGLVTLDTLGLVLRKTC